MRRLIPWFPFFVQAACPSMSGLIAVSVVIFMKRSRTGQAIRATAQDPRAARVLGINIDRIYAHLAFNSALCGAAGVLALIIFVIQPFY